MPFPFHRLLALALAACALRPAASAQSFTHTESRHTHSIAITPDGTRLLAVNSADARLSVFAIADPASATPVLVSEIPVGLEPVAVRARTADEAWVVSELGDSVSIVSLSARAVVATLRAPDEPADVVFAQGRAFVSCARNNVVRVFDVTTRAEIAVIPVAGLVPSALAVNGSGTSVFAIFLHSGNGTTILPPAQAPAPPVPTNPNLPPAPQTGLIVPASDSRIPYTVLDRDVVEIDATTLQVVRYLGGAGTNLFDVAVHPVSGDLWVANSEARNLVRFEPVLRGHVVDHRLTRLQVTTGAATAYDLNAGVDYSLLPNPAAQATALAQPTAIAFTPDGSAAWVAAFNSDRVAAVDTATGAVLTRVELRATGDGTRQMRGPRALALDAARQRLYALNKLAGTISVIGTGAGTPLAEVPLGSTSPLPTQVREGRGFLFDARLSGNGLTSCASCHPDADRDGLAWDLGDPGGQMLTVMGANLVIHDPTPRPRVMHPMKGPMVTQTLRGMSGGAPFHWRGDRATLQSFNVTFPDLLGGPLLAAADFDALVAYLLTLRNHPNPNLRRDGTPPPVFAGGDPIRGADLFTRHENHCSFCHEVPRGTNNVIDLPQEVGALQPIKNPTIRTTYQRLFFNPQVGQSSLSGFGLNHDGSGFLLPTVHPYVLDELGTESLADFADVKAFVLCFPTETKPAVGDGLSVTAATAGTATTELAVLEQQARQLAVDLVARGIVAGRARSFFYNRTLQRYETDSASEATLTRTQLLALLATGDVLTFLGAPPGEGRRVATDRDGDGTRDADEAVPILMAGRVAGTVQLRWSQAATDWALEAAPSLHGPWAVVTRPRAALGADWQTEEAITGTARFFRLRRTW